jgi:ankyrin repeat protein
MNDNNKPSKQARPQEFELIELLFREYISSHIARPDIEYSFQARFQSFINQIPSYLHSSSKTGFFTHFFFGSFASLLDTTLGQKLGIQKLYFNFDKTNHLRIVAETDDKTHVFIFTENNKNKKQNKYKKIDFTKDEWKTITGQEYTDDDNKKLEINIININKSTGSINVTVEKKNIQDGESSKKQYHELTKQFVNKDGQYIPLEDSILILSNSAPLEVLNELKLILVYTKKIHDHYPRLPYGDGAKEAAQHGFVAGIFNNFRYRENANVYLEQFAGKGYADIVLLVRGADRSPKSIPIIIELKAGTGSGTNSHDALMQVEEYTKGFQPNNMRILSFSDNILCVGVNLDSPNDSFMVKVVKRDQEIVPLIQSITDTIKKIKDSNLDIIKQEIQSNLQKTYDTFSGTGEKSSAHYMSRFILGESLVLRDYDKHIFIYDKESYIPTATVINDHDTRFNKKPKIERTVDGSNAVNSILLVSKDQDNNPAIVLNIIDINREVNNVIKLPLDTVTVGNRKIISLDIEFRLDKSQEGFQQYCDVEIGKIYNSVLEYNNENTIKAEGAFHKISFKDSVELVAHMKNAIDSQAGLVISESYYKELIGKVGEVVYPIKSLIGRESEFQGLLEGIFKYYSDVKLSEGSERRELVLTEFQTGAGGRIDMLVQAIGSSEQGSKEYIPVGLELKYDDSIKLGSFGKKQDENIQKILLEGKEQQVVEKLLQDQTERYSKGAAIKSITDGNKVGIIGVVFNGQAQELNKLLLTTNQFLESDIVHSSKLYTISHGVMVPNINDLPPPESEGFIPDWVEQEVLDEFAKIQGEDETLLSLFNKNINDDKIAKLQNVLKHKEHLRSIDGIDLSYNELTAKNIPGLVKMLSSKLIYLDLSDNDLAKDNFAEFKELISKIEVPILKISDIGMQNKQMKEIIMLLKKQDKVSHLEIQHLEQQTMDRDTAHGIGRYISYTNILEYLDLSRCGIHDVAAKRISNNLYKQNTLKTLILSDNHISAKSALKFKYALPKSVISHFDLSGNPLGIDGFAHIVEGVVSSSSNVKVLKLVDVGVKYDRYNREQAEHLANAIKSLFSNTKLTSVDVSYNNIGTGLLSQIFDILSKARHGHSLRDVSLAGNTIDWGSHQVTIDTLKARIGQFFEKNKNIRSLNMADMELDDELGREVAQGLDKSGLIHLDLSGNINIGKKTISELANTLSTHQYLKYLNLSDTKCSVKDVKDLLTGLKSNQDLTHLNLSHNDLSEMFYAFNGGRVLNLDHQDIYFNNILQGNTSLKYLNVAYCKLSYNSLKSLFALLKEKSSLEVLDIRGNKLVREMVDDIVEMLRENSSQGLNGLQVLHIDKGDLDSKDLRKLTDKSLGISVIVDDDIPEDLGLSEAINPTCTIQSWDIKQKNLMLNDEEYNRITLETATSSGRYDYWLQQHDIPDIARVHYNYQVDELEVVGSNDQLSRVLENYRSSQHAHPFTIILNIGENGNGGDHWVSMVLHRVSNEYHAYYTDSFGHEMRGSTASIMNNNNILIHNVGMVQQSDGYNCGLWALENASAIRNVITRPNYNINIQDMLNNLPQHSSETLNNLRRDIALELSHDDQRVAWLLGIGVDLREIDMIPKVYRNDFLADQADAVALAGCLASYSITSSKSKRSIGQVPLVNSDTVVDGKWFLYCTNKLSTNIFIPYLINVLSKSRIKDDNTCDQVEQFFLEQKVIDDLKKEMPEMKQESTLITKALEKHDIELFKVVCKRYGNKFNQIVDVDGRTLLHMVVHYDDAYQWVNLLIDYNVSIDVKDSAGNTALYYSIVENKYGVIELLIKNGANVNSFNEEGNSLLLYSVMHSVNNNLNVTKLLIDNGTDINALNNNNTVLYLSVLKNNTNIVEFLLQNQADVNMHNNGNDTALNAAISMNNTLMVDLLVQYGANVSVSGHHGNTPLMIATSAGNKQLVKKLIGSGADVNTTNDDGVSAISIIAGAAIVVLVIAVSPSVLAWIGSVTGVSTVVVGGIAGITLMVQGGRQGYTKIDSNSDIAEIGENLLNQGANLNVVNNFGNTMLHEAVTNGNYEMVQLVSNRGINVNAVNNEGNTALHIGTSQLRYRGRTTRDVANDNIMEKIIDLLIKMKASVSIRNNNNETPIYLAAIKQNPKIIELFLNQVEDSKVLLERANNHDKTLLHLMLNNPNSEISSKVLDFQDQKGMSILSVAVLNNDYEAIELLVTHGANVNIQNREDGNTPLHFAAQSNNMTLIKYLIEHGAQVLIKNDDDQYALQHHFILFKNVVDKHGNSMLMHAVKGHDVDLVLSLLQASVSLDIQNVDCNTALHIAVLEKQLKIYQLLLQYHADVNIRDCNGKTATQLAEDTSFIVSCRLESVEHQNLLSKSSTTTHVKDTHHKHRHHHGENAIDHRGRRDIDHSWHVFTKDSNHDNDDHLLDARDDILVVRNAGSSLKPLGDNIVHWIRDSILLFKTLNPIRQENNLFNEYNDKTKTITSDLDISDNVGCKEGQKQDTLVNKFSIVQEINDQIYELGEAQLAATKLLQELCQQFNSVEKEILRQEELVYTIISIYQKEEDLTIKQGDAQDKKQELYHIKKQIESQKSLIENLKCELNSLNQELAMLNVEDNNLSLYHELPYWNKSLEEDVEVDDDIADQVPIWISNNHHINVGNLPNAFIGNDRDNNQVLDDSLCDFQGTLSLWNLLIRKKYGVHYNHQHDIMQSEEVNTEYAHRLAYSSYAPNVEKQAEDIELVGVV